MYLKKGMQRIFTKSRISPKDNQRKNQQLACARQAQGNEQEGKMYCNVPGFSKEGVS